MALRLQDKLALVTAAGQGIGRAIAEAFVAEGARVIATDVDDKKLEGMKSLKRHKLDARSTESVDALAKASQPTLAVSTCSSTVPGTCIMAAFSTAPSRIGTSRLIST